LWCAKGFLFAVGEFLQILSGFLFFGYLGAIFPSTFLVVLVVILPSLWLSRVTHPSGGLAHPGLTSVFLVSVLVFAVSTFLSAFWLWALPFFSFLLWLVVLPGQIP